MTCRDKSGNRTVHLAGAFLIALGLTAVAETARAQGASRCDELAAHPEDPEAVVNGVYDGDIDILAAIPACESELDQDPDSTQLQFQLGRAYWEADRDDEAIDLFRRAALGGDYAAAYAFLGIAYEYGYATGRPETELARSLYMIAQDRGFEPATDLLAALAADRPMNAPPGADPISFDGYYQPEILHNIHEERFDALNQNPLEVVFYLRGMYDFFKQEVNWFDLRCAHLHDTRLTQKVIRNLAGAGPGAAMAEAGAIVERVLAQAQGMFQSGDYVGLINGYLDMQILPDEGKRDAGHLVSDHDNNCEAETIKRLYKNAQYYFLREMSFN